jgi:3-oxoacyl-[acyl-carrier-protein] synthase II
VSVAVVGWSAVTGSGVGARALSDLLADQLAGQVSARGRVRAGTPLEPDWDGDPLPDPTGHALPGLSARELLGRKGTGSYDRATTLAVVAYRDALAEAGIELDDDNRTRLGVVVGTTVGSFKSTSDFSRETLVQPRPYLVNPMLFPNTVMNVAAGQVAIRLGLRGVNATVAGGPTAFLGAVRYAANVIDRGYADVMLAGAVEEFSAHRAWAAQLTGASAQVPLGEGAAAVVLARADVPAWAGPRRDAEILAVATGYGPGGADARAAALASCVRRALSTSGCAPSAVTALFTGEAGADDDTETGPAVAALGHHPERFQVKRLLGECDAASGALALAVLLAQHGAGERPGQLSLLTAAGADGSVSAAVVRGAGRAGTDRG